MGVHACCRPCLVLVLVLALQVNVIQSLLRAILALRPLPPLPVDLLGALAVGFNAWHTVIPALEHQVCPSCSESTIKVRAIVQDFFIFYYNV